jgi:hypothetical protein
MKARNLNQHIGPQTKTILLVVTNCSGAITRMSGSSVFMRQVASIPSISGIEMSITITSGLISRASSSASLPLELEASPPFLCPVVRRPGELDLDA